MAGAGELSTGALLQCHLLDHGNWSMLVVESKMKFYKKATSTVQFTCEDGEVIAQTIKTSIDSGQPQKLRLTTIGRIDDIQVCELEVLWSIKKKKG